MHHETKRRTSRHLRALAAAGALVMLAPQVGCAASALAGTPVAPAAAEMPPGAAPPAPSVVLMPAEQGARRDAAALGAKTLGAHSSTMLVYTAELTMAVYHVTESMDAVQALGERAGGYLSVRSDTRITVRVPEDRFEDTLAQVAKIGDVLHRDLKAEDVTDQFVDTQARLKNARAMRDRLETLLQKAPVKEAIDIQRELGKVTEEIERLEGRLNVLRDQIAFSTISVGFEPVREQGVHDTSLVGPFPWLADVGLSSLLEVDQ